MPKHLQVIEKSIFPPSDDSRATTFDPSDQMYHTVVFPALKPAGRRDVALLESWLDEQLQKLGGAGAFGRGGSGGSRRAKPGAGVETSSAETVREQLKLLTIGFNEVVRQVGRLNFLTYFFNAIFILTSLNVAPYRFRFTVLSGVNS